MTTTKHLNALRKELIASKLRTAAIEKAITALEPVISIEAWVPPEYPYCYCTDTTEPYRRLLSRALNDAAGQVGMSIDEENE